jgi:hypothetical protein
VGNEGLDEFIETLRKRNEFIYNKTGIDEFKQNMTPHIIWSTASMNGKEK